MTSKSIIRLHSVPSNAHKKIDPFHADATESSRRLMLPIKRVDQWVKYKTRQSLRLIPTLHTKQTKIQNQLLIRNMEGDFHS